MGTSNEAYSNPTAARYAIQHGDTPNYTDYHDCGQNCTNFVSQCLHHDSNLPFNPSSPLITTSTTNINNWFQKKFIGDAWRTAETWSKTDKFYQHWKPSTGRSYRCVEYHTGADALADTYLMSYINMGDVIQYGNNESIFHSMFAYKKIANCNGIHKINDSCPNIGAPEVLYAQNVGIGSNYTNGHLCYVLYYNLNKSFIFTKLNDDFDC